MAKNFWENDAPAEATTPAAPGGDFWLSDRPAAQQDLPAGVTPSTAGAGRGTLGLAAYQRTPAAPAPRASWEDDAAQMMADTASDQPVGKASVLEGRVLGGKPWSFKEASQAQRATEDAYTEHQDRIARYGSAQPITGKNATVGSVATGLVSDLKTGGMRARAGMRQMAADLTGSKNLEQLAIRERAQADLESAINTPRFESETAQGIYSGLSSTIRQAPSIAAGIVTRNPSVALGGMVAPIVPDEYAKIRYRGGSPTEALVGATGSAAAEYLTEKMPMSFLVKRFGKAGAGEFLTGMLAREVPSEQVATLTQDAIDTAIANPDKTWGEYLQERPSAAYQTLLATVTQTGIMGGASAGARKIAEALQPPPDRAPQIKALRQQGDETAAKRLEARAQREQAAYSADLETQALADFGEAVQQQYREIRLTGVKPGDAVVQAAIRTRYEQAAQMAGISPKAKAALEATLHNVPPEKAPAVVQKYITALANAGAAQPFDGMDTLALDIEAQMDGMLDAVISGQIAPTQPMESQDEANAVPVTETAAGQATDPAGATEPASVVQAGAVAVSGGDQQGDAGALSETNDVQVTPEMDAVHQAATSPLNDLPEPTKAQKDAGNYKVGRLRINGLDISIENPQGSVRRGTDQDGNEWSTPLRDHYGYFKGTTAADGDKLDVFIKPGTPDDFAGTVYVVDQIDPKTGKFDEAKVIFGAADQAEAEAIYRRNYSEDWQGLGAITPLPMPAFKTWAVSKETRKPLGDITRASTNVQDAPQGTDRAPAQAEANQAPEAARGDDAAAAGVPAEGDTTGVQTAGVTGAQLLGKDSIPIAEGGKPFKTKAEADKVRKLQPMMLVVKSGKGFALAPKTPAQIAAQEKAAKRLGSTGNAGIPMAAHELLASRGGLSKDTMSDLGFDRNQRVGARWLFAGTGGMSIEQATEALQQNGFMQGTDQGEAIAMIQRSARGNPVYTPQGYEQIAQAEADARFEDYLSAHQEAAQEGEDFDPFPPDAGYTDADAEAAGFDDASPEDKAAFAALLQQAEAEGIDTELILERAAQNTQEGTDDDYREQTRTLIEAARSERAAADQRADTEQGREDAQREGGADGRQGDGQPSAEAGTEGVSAQLRPDGTLAVTGDTQALRERLTAAGIPARSILPSATGVIVGKTQAGKAREVLEPKAPIDIAKLSKDFRTYPERVLEAIVERGNQAVLFKAAKVKSADGFGSLPMDDRADAYVAYVQAGNDPVDGLPADYNAWVAAQERDAENRRMQTERVIRQANGKPFKTEDGARQAQERFDAKTTHKIAPVEGGFELRLLPPAAQDEARRLASGRESYTEAQTAVLAEMGIGETADGEIDATDAQWEEIDRRVNARLRGEPTLTAPTKADIEAQQDRAEQADQLDERAQIKRESEAGADTFTLAQEDGRQDTTGNLFSQAEPDAQPAAKPPERIDDLGEKIGGARKDTSMPVGKRAKKKVDDERPAWARRYQIAQVAEVQGLKDAGRWVIRDTKNLDWNKQPRLATRDSFDTQEAAEAMIPIVAVGRNHRAVPSRDGKYELWRDINDRKRVKIVNKTFDTREDALRYMLENAVEIIEANTTFGEADLPKPPSTQRVGAERRSGNVQGPDFMRTFGFRGVEFGNWNSQEERQEVMNEAFDGLLDLAEVMGIPPKAISMNGELALAFGARGHGLSGARAHYEPQKAVINLTKMNGAGALAHEWFHAMDHYFGRQDGKASSKWETGKDGTRSLPAASEFERDGVTSGFGRNSGVRAEVRAAYDELMQTIFRKAETYVEDTEKADRFVATMRKEVQSQLDSIRKDLAEQRDPRYYKTKNKPASAEQLAEFDTVAQQILDGTATDIRYMSVPGSKSLTGGRWSNDALEKISAIYKDVRGRSGFDSTNQRGFMDRLRATMSNYAARLKMLADAQDGSEKTKKVPTEFAMDAKSLDQGRGKDYWTTPHEMAARAFQGYVEDRIAEMGGRSPFLNYGPENAGILTPWGVSRPYPAGTERKAINAAIDNLVKTIQTRETDDGNVAMFSRPLTADLFRQMTTPMRRGMTVSEVELAIAQVVKRWKNGPTINVVQTTADLPMAAPSDAHGVYFDGQVYLVARNIGSPTQAKVVLVHEAVAHYGLKAMLGDAVWKRYASDIQLALKTGNKPLKAIQDQVRMAYVDDAGQFNLTPEQEADEIAAKVAEEAVNEQGEFRPGFGFVKAVYAKIAEFLRSIGFDVKMTMAELQGALVNAQRHLQAGQRLDGAMRSPVPVFAASGDQKSLRALEAIAQTDDLFALQKSTKTDLQGIADDNAKEIKIRETKFPGNETMYTMTLPSGGVARLTVRQSTPDSVYGANDLGDGEYDWIKGRPGDNPQAVRDDAEDVWIDVSNLKPGNEGALIYNIAATFAHNTGRIFIGDPSGLSDEALRRRTEQMLSSALKFGTTDHLAPHPRQVEGDAKLGVPGLKWVYGDTAGNIERMIDVSIKALDNALPGSNIIRYDRESGLFYRTDTGQRFQSIGQLSVVVGRSLRNRRGRAGEDGRSGQAGWRTVARAALFRELKTASDVGSGAQDGRGILDLLRIHASGVHGRAAAIRSGDKEGRIFYSRSAPVSAQPAAKAPAPSPATATATPAQQPIQLPTPAQPSRAPLPEETRARAAQRRIQDQFNRFTVIRNWAKEQGMNLSRLSDVWGFEERMHGRMATRIEDFREKRVQPLVDRIQKAGFTMDQVAEFLHAQHAEERNRQIQSIDPNNPAGSGMDTATARGILAAASSELAKLANELRSITDDTKAILLQGGIISQEMADAWDKAYKHYVPLKGGDEAVTQQGTGKGLSVKATNKRAMGHSQRQEFIIENILRDHERAVMLVEKNRVGHSLLAMTIELGREDIATFGQPVRRKVLKNSTEYEVVGKNGTVVGTFDSQQAANAFIVTQTRPGLTVRPVKGDPVVSFMASPMLAENEVQVYVKGQTVRIQLNDPLLARAYKKLGVENLTKMMQVNREINGFLSKAYTGYNPEFFIKNVLRDFTSGLINITGQEGAGIAAKAAALYPIAFAQMLRYSFSKGHKASPSIKLYRENGGTTGAAYLSDIERVGADIQAAYEEYQGAARLAASGRPIKAANVAVRKLVKGLVGWMEHLNAAGENAMRLAVFDAVRNTPGRTIQEAASLAKNSTVNFNRKGEIGAQANALYLFFNAAMQGSAATLDAMFMGKHKHQAQAVAAALGGLAYSVAALQFGGDDEEDRKAWEKIPDHVKDRNLIIRTGEDTYITLAIPYGYGFFFSAGNAVFDLMQGADKDKIALKLTSGMLEHFGPAINPLSGDELDSRGMVELMPGVFGGEIMRATGRLLVNRSGLGGEIVPDSPFDEGKPDSQRMFRTSKGTGYEAVAGTLNQLTGGTKSQPGYIDISPETVKFWTQTITGGAGKFVVDSTTAASLMAARLTETDPALQEALTPEVREIPLSRTLVRREDIRDARRVYWEHVKEAQQAQQAFKRAEKMADEKGMLEVIDQQGYLLGMGKAIESNTKAIARMRDAIDVINASEDYTLAEKRLMIKDLERGERELYEAAIEMFTQVKKSR